MQNCAAPSARGGLADAVLVHERAAPAASPRPSSPEDRVGGTRTSVERDLGVVGGHVERPPVESTLEARAVGRHEERGDAAARARLAARAREDEVVGGDVHAGVEALGAVDDPVVAVAARRVVSSQVASRAVVGLGQAEGEPHLARDAAARSARLLLGRAERVQHQHGREVADDRRLVLRVVVQAEAAAARCSRMTAMSRLVPSRPPSSRAARSAGGPPRRRGARISRRSSSHSRVGTPPCSMSVRANSRRWSKKRMLSFSLLERSDLALDERVDLGEQSIGGGRNCLNPSRV